MAQARARTRGMEEDNVQKRVQTMKTVVEAVALVNSIPATAPIREHSPNAINRANDVLTELLSRLAHYGGDIFVDETELEQVMETPLTIEGEVRDELPPITAQGSTQVGITASGTGSITGREEPSETDVGLPGEEPIG